MPLPMTRAQALKFRTKMFHGDDPYDQGYQNGTGNFDDLPHALHVHYLGFNDMSMPVIRSYFYSICKDLSCTDPIEQNQVESLISDIIQYGALDDPIIPPYAMPLDELVWRRKCYVAFIMDNDNFRFWPNAGIFFEDKDSGTKNHSFYDAKDFTVSVPQKIGRPKMRTGVYCINHMKDENAVDIGPGVSEFFSFSLVFKLPGTPKPWKYDPGGTNLGPPVGPPV